MTQPTDNLRGAAFMAGAAVVFTIESLFVRWMTERGIPVATQVLFRAVGQLAWTLPAILASGVAVFATGRPVLHTLRGLSSLSTWGFYFLAFATLDLATGTVLSFTNVLFSTVAAALLLNERVDRVRWAATILGFLGVAVMLRPGADIDPFGALAMLVSAICWCGITIGSRVLTRTESTGTIIAWVGLVTTLGALPLAILFWQPLALADWLILLAFAGFTPAILVLLTEAFRWGEASAVGPLQYTRVVMVALPAWLIWNEVPGVWTWVGGGVIVSSALWLTLHEARKRQQR